jgi:hypothetical protein
MNRHISRGNEAFDSGDLDRAIREFCKALDDPDKLVQRIARNRLRELSPDVVYGSSSSKLYHWPDCPAKQAIWRSHPLTFKNWREAESAGYAGCPTCNPPRSGSRSIRAR